MFPALWNFFVDTATRNDTFLAGVDGAGYVFVAELGDHEQVYESRAGSVMARLGPNVVDTGVAQAGWGDGAYDRQAGRQQAPVCWFVVSLAPPPPRAFLEAHGLLYKRVAAAH